MSHYDTFVLLYSCIHWNLLRRLSLLFLTEYRALLGLPGGTSNDSYSKVNAAAQAKGMSLQIGKGNDPDTLGTKSVFVYDSNKFPFYQAEVYHQYHDDFQSPAYGKAYNALGMKAFDEGRIKSTGCPDIV